MILLIADVHLGVSNNDPIFLEQSKNLFKTVIDECHRRNINEIIILGDFFDDRKSINVKTLNVALEIANMLKENDIKLYLIIGNHDIFYKTETTTNSLNLFKEFKNIYVVDETLKLDNIGLTSWNQTIDMDVDYLFGHFEINDFNVSENVFSKNAKYSVQDFKKYKKVISGHYHIPSNHENVIYLGTPYHLSFGDCNGVRGYYLFDNGELTFIEYKEGIKFVKILCDDIENKNIKGNIVKLIFTKDYGTVGNQKIIDKVQSYNPLRFFTHFDIHREESIENEKEMMNIKSSKEMLFDFIKLYDNPDYINHNTLFNIINELLEENV